MRSKHSGNVLPRPTLHLPLNGRAPLITGSSARRQHFPRLIVSRLDSPAGPARFGHPLDQVGHEMTHLCYPGLCTGNALPDFSFGGS